MVKLDTLQSTVVRLEASQLEQETKQFLAPPNTWAPPPGAHPLSLPTPPKSALEMAMAPQVVQSQPTAPAAAPPPIAATSPLSVSSVTPPSNSVPASSIITTSQQSGGITSTANPAPAAPVQHLSSINNDMLLVSAQQKIKSPCPHRFFSIPLP